MLVAIFGESCSGKSTLANRLNEHMRGRIYSGKDYFRLAKNENEARKIFIEMLANSVNGENIIYVIAQREHLSLLPKDCIRVLVLAPLDTIIERFTVRMKGILPPPVKNILINNHGTFDNEECNFTFHSTTDDLDSAVNKILAV